MRTGKRGALHDRADSGEDRRAHGALNVREAGGGGYTSLIGEDDQCLLRLNTAPEELGQRAGKNDMGREEVDVQATSRSSGE